MGSNNSHKWLKRNKSHDVGSVENMLQVNTMTLTKLRPKGWMIEKLERNEIGFENSKIFFRKKYQSGTISSRRPGNLLDKGKFLSKATKMHLPETHWTKFLYRKLNWWNQHFQGQYRWNGVINKLLTKKLDKFVEVGDTLYHNFASKIQRCQSASNNQDPVWNGIKTNPTNLSRFNKLKEHLAMNDHPLARIIVWFQKWMVQANNFLLCPKEYEVNFEQVKEELVDNIQRFIALMYFTIIKFYKLTFKDNVNNSDILLDIITSRVVTGKLYMALYNVISYCLQSDIKKLNEKMVYEEHVDFDNSRFIAGVSEIFSFSENVRKNRLLGKYQSSPYATQEGTQVYNGQDRRSDKYSRCIKMIWELKNIESPSLKNQLLVKIVNQVKHEIDEFWDGIDITQDEKWIDAYNMEKILSYVVVKSKYQKIVVDLELIETFAGENMDYSCEGYIFANFQGTVNGILQDEEAESPKQVANVDLCPTPAFRKNGDTPNDFLTDDSICSDQDEEKEQNPKTKSFLNRSPVGSNYSLLLTKETGESNRSIWFQIAC